MVKMLTLIMMSEIIEMVEVLVTIAMSEKIEMVSMLVSTAILVTSHYSDIRDNRDGSNASVNSNCSY